MGEKDKGEKIRLRSAARQRSAAGQKAREQLSRHESTNHDRLATDNFPFALDPAVVLKATPRSFALRVRGQSMVGAGIYDGDIVVGEFTPQAQNGAIVVVLDDGDSTLKRLMIHEGQPKLVSENCPDLIPLSELVIQGVVHTLIRRV